MRGFQVFSPDEDLFLKELQKLTDLLFPSENNPGSKNNPETSNDHNQTSATANTSFFHSEVDYEKELQKDLEELDAYCSRILSGSSPNHLSLNHVSPNRGTSEEFLSEDFLDFPLNLDFPLDTEYEDELQWESHTEIKFPNSYRKLSYRTYWKSFRKSKALLYPFRLAFRFLDELHQIAQKNYSYFDEKQKRTIHYDYNPNSTFPLKFLIPYPYPDENNPGNIAPKIIHYLEKFSSDPDLQKALKHLSEDPFFYPKEWLENDILLEQFIKDGFRIYEKQMRNQILVWMKTFEFLKKHHFQFYSITQTFKTMKDFVNFIQDGGLPRFLETLKKTLTSFAKKHRPPHKNKKIPPKVYYLAYYEFHEERLIPHIHILIATNFKFKLSDLTTHQSFKFNWKYGRIDLKKIHTPRKSYALKYSQKPPLLYGMLKYFLQKTLGIRKTHFLYVSKELIKDFPHQHKKLKHIKSFLILKHIGIYATDITKLSKHHTIFHFPHNFEIHLKNVYNFSNNNTTTQPTYLYSTVSLKHPSLKKPVSYRTKSIKQLINLLKLLVSKIHNYIKNKFKNTPHQLNLFIHNLHKEACLKVFHTPIHLNHTINHFLEKLHSNFNKPSPQHNRKKKLSDKASVRQLLAKIVYEGVEKQHSYITQQMDYLIEIGIERIKNLLLSLHNSNLKYKQTFQKDYVGYISLIPNTLTRLDMLRNFLLSSRTPKS